MPGNWAPMAVREYLIQHLDFHEKELEVGGAYGLLPNF